MKGIGGATEVQNLLRELKTAYIYKHSTKLVLKFTLMLQRVLIQIVAEVPVAEVPVRGDDNRTKQGFKNFSVPN